MIFVIVGVVILIASFLIALISLVSEREKLSVFGKPKEIILDPEFVKSKDVSQEVQLPPQLEKLSKGEGEEKFQKREPFFWEEGKGNELLDQGEEKDSIRIAKIQERLLELAEGHKGEKLRFQYEESSDKKVGLRDNKLSGEISLSNYRENRNKISD